MSGMSVCGLLATQGDPVLQTIPIILLFVLLAPLLTTRACESYLKMYRERRQVALSFADEPYDFGRDPKIVWAALRTRQPEDDLEAARRKAVRHQALGIAVALTAGVAVAAVHTVC